ncbi:CBU_0592 family membrane protein [Bailinhaonella thermotolerans]|uniref:CBU-0592-like domain-containing protein n=1 Tax=Bailinhaonella thermotolerans TaxID=1070861 RepID=A0A3A4AW38_9ACTN|nr:hypothetical protein [Bailinhaonella thermotolerans]RJL32547.1 hypothetical protein D5H75_13570 [Bailinhaonella thermotolerans]
MIDVLAWAGAGALLLAYALVSMRRMDGDGAGFQLLNLLGSLALGVNAARQAAWPSAAVNAIWVVIGLAMLARLRAARDRPV